ncbi:decaprenyl-phosphate phosphoribosyltransferase [Propioniciclava tarda]|uniref:Decaprenyl-phosphate phosphoribosyltransferase n=1 Tax=Propioniciclava tarda TaxID=433330 RepID=A0A4Q9KLC0_PROTD|nr:decaprenyl-phosphate phosphoribosyltransferase [Propioniciclava tarda]TBT95316.1 decaprenyl-phosphate phosphoribosyltransferase [Propioniciclava tarda]SMO60782.1 decaprenyl-phosphate phosphoribosyltransferase [Propioniciclava tarda]
MSDQTGLEPRRSALPAPLRAMRPKQWVKNVLVLAAPAAAGVVLQPRVLAHSLAAFVAFCAVSASIYLINDVRDVESDRQHPKKRFRPIAAGELKPSTALAMAAVLVVLAAVGGYLIAPLLALVIVVYWLLQVGYSVFAKNQPIIDLAMVAAGFLLRAVAGGVASSIPLSQWFLLVASFGSLFMVAGKRYSEMIEVGPDAGTRASLASYTPTYLRFVWTLSAALVVMSYALWAFDLRSAPVQWLGVPWDQVSIAPFTLAMLRYAYAIDRGAAGEPEDAVLGDRTLQVLGLAWAITLGLTFVH